MKPLVLGLLVVGLCTAAPLSAQIVIDWTEIPHDVGTQWSVNIKYDVTVGLGSQGGPHIWNFTSQPMGTDTVNFRIVSKGTTPFADTFPNANLVYKSTEDIDTIYQYMELNPDDYGYCGLGFASTGSTYVIQYDPMDTIPLPLSYGDSRHYYSFYSLETGPDFLLTVEKHGFQSLDAYGTVTIPLGTFDCLRTCSFDTCATTIFFMGIPILSDTVTHINYSFLTENHSTLVCIASHPGETNPNYTWAMTLERLLNFSTGIEESDNRTLQSMDHELRAYPNPFTLYCNVATPGGSGNQIPTLRIYDLSGRLIETTESNTIGRNLRAGIYFVNADGYKSLKVLKLQ
ncbi:T9SS type A sorting domain-containing protein [candidate division TA06 bacterium]|uniref:T9SS type A sorting domain-containing protein n=1 Tax=candidate division TA06 bacterium TaxID=2250710 RepID=A0A523UXE6_UNCT6|nr:MAG: T9SS type A sorting domain-containing protein [candidate division TA06 bacterium]